MKKQIVRIIIFCILLLCSLAYVRKVLSFKFADGNQIMVDFHRLEKNTVDVLILGSSHAYTNYNNGTLWDDYGIASYNLGSSEQPLWNTYYYLKDALKTQKPELIILEGFGTAFNFDYSALDRVVKNTYGMKWSRDRVEATKVSVTDDNFREMLLDYSRFHSRYSRLNKGDFFEDSNYIDSGYYMHYTGLMGQYFRSGSTPLVINDYRATAEPISLWEKSGEYYIKILELAKENNIPIAVIITPYDVSQTAYQYFLMAEEIAKEYDVPFLNGIYKCEEAGIDLNTDYHDSAHFTAQGSVKWTRYVEKFLLDNFELPDRRGDEKYSAWERTAELTRRYIATSNINQCNDMSELAKLINDTDYMVIISSDGYFMNNDDSIWKFMNLLGVTDKNNYLWIRQNGNAIWQTGNLGTEWYLSTRDHDILVERVNENDMISNNIIVDGKITQVTDNGVNVLLYDSYTDVIADSFGINVDTHCIER